MKCEWQTQRQIVPDSKARVSKSPEREESLAITTIDPWDTLPGDELAERKHLLRYYIEAFVPSVSVATTASSFYTSLYIPMAFDSEGMLDAITAMSSAQLARRSSDPERAKHYRELSSKQQARCHTFLRSRLGPDGAPVTDTYQVLGILLLLVGLECLNGNKNTRWLSQIQCARKIMDSLCWAQVGGETWELEALHRHFTYHEVMASLMVGIVPTEAPSPAELMTFPYRMPENKLTIDPLMGISYYLCSIITRIQYVTSSAPAFPNVSKAAFDAVERDIQQWVYESPIFAPDIDLPIALDLIALAESYRLAALIQLYRTSEEHKHLIPGCASRAMQFVARIPPGSPAESSLLYPIFLAGAELEGEEEISKCYERLNAIQQRNRYENTSTVQEVLQEVWKPALNGGEKKDWEQVLREFGWSFSLG
jgi:hypothetical protein